MLYYPEDKFEFKNFPGRRKKDPSVALESKRKRSRKTGQLNLENNNNNKQLSSRLVKRELTWLPSGLPCPLLGCELA